MSVFNKYVAKLKAIVRTVFFGPRMIAFLHVFNMHLAYQYTKL